MQDKSPDDGRHAEMSTAPQADVELVSVPDMKHQESERGPEAEGRELSEVPLSYWYSPAFLGSFTAIGMSFLAASGGYGLVSPLISYIDDDIGPSGNIVWVSLTWLLLEALTYLVSGRMSDIFGRRWFFIIGSCIGLIGSIIGACAQSVNQLIGAMVFLGISSGIMLCFFWVSAEIVPMKYRYLANAGTYIFSIPTNPLAAKLAYAFQTQTNAKWRGCFYFEIAAHAVAIACWYFFYHPPTYKMLHRQTPVRELLKYFDWVGLVLWIGSTLVLLMGISWGGGLYPWKSSYVIGTIVAGAVGTSIFAIWEWKLPLKGVEPFFPLYLFKNGRYMAVTWLTGFASSNYYALVLMWPAAVTNIYSVSGSYESTLFALPGMCFVFGSIVGSIVATYTGPRLPTIGFMAIATAFLGAAATNPLDMQMTMAFVILGCFMVGAADGIAIATTTFPVPQEQIGAAGGLAGFMRLFVSTVAVAVYTTVENNKLASNIPREIAKAVANTTLPSSSIPALVAGFSGKGSLDNIPGATSAILDPAHQGYRTAYSQAIATVFLANLAFCGVALILSFFVANNDASQANYIAGHIHTKADERARDGWP
ncbi:hypothetical protein SBRCBS47491_009358 [Sporothrix bragantina]|uniref:Major facilitator superfamily (MFS) profile domain-containing protein n=1 Tax=Sporothrix bragantina TaxID=671064 RepID=A0ABP0CX97_9PEZI